MCSLDNECSCVIISGRTQDATLHCAFAIGILPIIKCQVIKGPAHILWTGFVQGKTMFEVVFYICIVQGPKVHKC